MGVDHSNPSVGLTCVSFPLPSTNASKSSGAGEDPRLWWPGIAPKARRSLEPGCAEVEFSSESLRVCSVSIFWERDLMVLMNDLNYLPLACLLPYYPGEKVIPGQGLSTAQNSSSKVSAKSPSPQPHDHKFSQSQQIPRALPSSPPALWF